MSVIERVEVTPNRVAILFHFLKGYPAGLKTDELEGLLSPAALAGKADQEGTGGYTPAEVRRQAKKLGLVEEKEKVWTVPAELRDLDEAGLRDYLELRLVHPDFAEPCEQANVPRALAWLLMQDPAKPLPWGERPEWAITEIADYDMGNNSTYQQMAYWARYLGYAWRLDPAKGSSLLVPDPTEALERHLRAIIGPGQRMEIAQLMAQLAQRSPILEGGTVRQKVEEKLPAEKRRGAKSLAASTSLALMRLTRRGVIHFERTADSEAMLLSPWAQSQPISHVELIG